MRTISVLLLLLMLTAARPLYAQDVAVTAPVFQLFSPEFEHNGMIPVRYSCRGADVSPPLEIRNIPDGTQTMVLTVVDPRGLGGRWVHWLVFNIPADTASVKENVPPGAEALNDFGNFYYGGPCPTDPSKHAYTFTLYAINSKLDTIHEGATLDTLLKSIEGKIIGTATLTGTFENVREGETNDL